MTRVDPLAGRGEVQMLGPRVRLAFASVVLLAGLVVIDFIAILVGIGPSLCENDGANCGPQSRADLRAGLIYLSGIPVAWVLVRCVMRLYLGGRRLRRRLAGALSAVAFWIYPYLAVVENVLGNDLSGTGWSLMAGGWLVLGGVLTMAGARRAAASRGPEG